MSASMGATSTRGAMPQGRAAAPAWLRPRSPHGPRSRLSRPRQGLPVRRQPIRSRRCARASIPRHPRATGSHTRHVGSHTTARCAAHSAAVPPARCTSSCRRPAGRCIPSALLPKADARPHRRATGRSCSPSSRSRLPSRCSWWCSPRRSSRRWPPRSPPSGCARPHTGAPRHP